MGLEPGMERVDEFVVEGRLLTDVGGTLRVKVLSTPSMIGQMERNAAILCASNLPETQGTVGFEVCVKHVAGAMEGARCTVRARVTSVDGRKVYLDVEVHDGDRTIGVGTHQRRVIDLEDHARRAGTA